MKLLFWWSHLDTKYFKVVAISIRNEDDVNCGNTNLTEDMIVAVVLAMQAIANSPKKISGL